jgi:hypothetical protein
MKPTARAAHNALGRALYSEEAQLVMYGAAPVRGKAAIRAAVDDMIKSGVNCGSAALRYKLYRPGNPNCLCAPGCACRASAVMFTTHATRCTCALVAASA